MILYWILKWMGNQWRLCRMGEMCEDIFVPVSSLAAAFCTDCKRRSVLWGSPASRLLQKSSLLVMKAWMSCSAAFVVSKRRIAAMRLRYIYETWQVWETCFFKFMLWSKNTPRLRASELGWTRVSPICMPWIWILCLSWGEEITRNSVLWGLNLSSYIYQEKHEFLIDL